MNGMAFQHYFKCLIFYFEFLAGILSYSLLNTNILMLNFFGKRPALNKPNTKSTEINSLKKRARLENEKTKMG
jgi:hypothetical protein